MRNKVVVILFVTVVVVAALLRLLFLSGVPSGLQQDETSIGYNALSILQTGKDEYGKQFPLYFKAFGEYKLPLSVYLTSLSFVAFGVSEFSLRFPSALFGILTVVCIFFLARSIFQKNDVSLLSMGLLALNPWHIHFSRGAYEVTPALFFITLGTYLYIRFVKNKSALFLALSISSFVISMYGYNIARLFVPLFIFVLIALAYKKIKSYPKTVFIIPFATALILLAPFITTVFTSGGYESTKGTLINTSAVVQSENMEIRSYILEENPLVAKAIFNSYISNVMYFLKNVSSHFNADFLFVSGSAHGNHGIGNVGQFYMFELFLIIVGIVGVTLSKLRWRWVLFLWIGGVILVASLTREAPHATRSFFMVVPLVLLSAAGLSWVISRVKVLKRPVSLVIFGIGILTLLYFISYYLSSYFYKFPVQYSKNYRSADKELVSFLSEKYNDYDVIYIDVKADLLYTSILFYSQFKPEEFQKSVIRARDDSEGFSRVILFGKYEYADLANILPQGRSLIIANGEMPGFRTIKKINYPTRPAVVAKGQEIVSFPVTETAYVLLEKN